MNGMTIVDKLARLGQVICDTIGFIIQHGHLHQE